MVMENQKGHGVSRALLFVPMGSLRAYLVPNLFQLYLEGAERYRTCDQFRLRFAVDRVRDEKSGCASDICSLSIFQILLDTVFIFAAAITTIEIIHIQAGLFGNCCKALVSERTGIFTEHVRK